VTIRHFQKAVSKGIYGDLLSVCRIKPLCSLSLLHFRTAHQFQFDLIFIPHFSPQIFWNHFQHLHALSSSPVLKLTSFWFPPSLSDYFYLQVMSFEPLASWLPYGPTGCLCFCLHSTDLCTVHLKRLVVLPSI
jgi:hypothetical protein